MIKPKQCCDFGTYECSVPMPINGRVQDVDLCISHIVAALNAGGVKTVASCCGHGKQNGIISLENGTELIVKVKRRVK